MKSHPNLLRTTGWLTKHDKALRQPHYTMLTWYNGPIVKRYAVLSLMALGVIVAAVGWYVCLTKSYDMDGVTFYPTESRIGEVIGYAGIAITCLGYWLHQNKLD